MQKSKELIKELVSTGGDVFITDDILNQDENTMYLHLQNIRDKVTFASIILSIILFVSPQNRIKNDFFLKNKNFIDQLWGIITYYNLWNLIHFISNLLLNPSG